MEQLRYDPNYSYDEDGDEDDAMVRNLELDAGTRAPSCLAAVF